MKYLFGSNPITSIVGYLLAGLYAYQLAQEKGATKWIDYAIPVAIAILGRAAGDTNNTVK